MRGIDLEKEFDFYKAKYLDEKSNIESILLSKDINDLFKDIERLRKKELIKFERLEQSYIDKIDRLEMDNIKLNKEICEKDKDIKKILNGMIQILDEVDELKELLEERNDLKGLKAFNKTFKKINKKVNYIGLERIKTISEQFNEDVHYCVEVIEGNEEENETIVEEVKSGYCYKGNVIRESRVVVIKNEGEI